MRTKFFAAGAAFCILGMTGCSNEIDEAGTPAGKQTVMTMQTATDGPRTRADYTDDGTKMNFSWRSGDRLSVMVKGMDDNKNCALTTATNGKSAPFSGTVTTFEGTKTIYAFYPYRERQYYVFNDYDKEVAYILFVLPETQAYTIGGAISNSLMLGASSATASGTGIAASVSLKQAMSIIKLNIKNAPTKVTRVKLKCADATFAIQASVKLSDATITDPLHLRYELSMNVTDNSTDHSALKEIYFAIFPRAKVDGKKIQIEVTYEDGSSKTIEKDDIDFERNMHYVVDFDGTPNAADYIKVNGIKVSKGNLVAKGSNGCMIGAPGDNGLYFQFGSLVGWSSAGDPTIAVKPTNYTGTKWDSSWIGDPTTDNAAAGTGDPCRYYLGNTWRLPTTAEYETLFNNTTTDWTGATGWSWNDTSKSAVHKDGLTFRASGQRQAYNGPLLEVGTSGYYWSTSALDKTFGYLLYISSNGLKLSSQTYRAIGTPVRCVQLK